MAARDQRPLALLLATVSRPAAERANAVVRTRMRILLVGDYPNDPRLGSTKVFHKLKEEFVSLGHDCECLFSDAIGDRPTQARLRWALGPALAARAIHRAIRERGPFDVLDVASAEGFVFGLERKVGVGRGIALISRSNGLEQLNYQRMLDDHTHGQLSKALWRRAWYPAVRLTQVAGAARLADRLLLLNKNDRAYAINRHWKAPGEIDVVAHGVSSRFLQDSPPPGAPRGGGILYCGTWTGVKGVDYLAAAFSALIARGAPDRLTILGGGCPEATIRSAFSTAAQANLTVLPRMSEDEVIQEYRRHDLLVFCSTYEGFGMVLLEAMSQGLPVISTPVGCATTLVKDNETGLLVPARNPERLSAAMEILGGDAGLRARLAERAFASVRGLTWRRCATQTLAVYGAAIDRVRAMVR